MRNIHQPPGTQLVVLECLPVHAQSDFVIDSSSHVAPMRRWKCLTCQWLEFHHVEYIFSRCGIQFLCERATDERAGSEEAQELAAGGEAIIHGRELYYSLVEPREMPS